MTDHQINRIKIIQNIDQAIEVMQDAGKWMEENDMNPSKWWKSETLNKEVMLQYANKDEFYVGIVDEKPAVAAILQFEQTAQDWSSVDNGNPPEALYIHWLSVARKFKGMNLAKFMIDFAEDFAKKNKVKLLRVDTNAEELKLKNLYEKFGFKPVGVEKKEHQETAFYQKLV